MVLTHVNQIDSSVAPRKRDGSSANGDATLTFKLQKIHHSVAIVHFAHVRDVFGVVEHALGHGRFACIDVCDDANVSYWLRC